MNILNLKKDYFITSVFLAVGEEALEGEEDGGWNPPPGGDNLPVEPPAPEIQDPAGEGEEQQWNPMEWDRAAEELTWERLLGKFLAKIIRFLFIFSFIGFSSIYVIERSY